MISSLRGLVGRVFAPLAAGLLRLGVTADAVTVTGTVLVAATALVLFPLGHLLLGGVLLTLFAFFDALDGTIARQAGTSGPWGAFLDSTLDRVADAAIFVGLAAYFQLRVDGAVGTAGVVAALACLVSGYTVSYARARAEALGYHAAVGIAERGERLVVAIAGAYLVGFGLSPVVLVVLLGLLAVASVITVGQRMAAVHAQARAGGVG